MVIRVVVHGIETWSMIEVNLNRLNTWEKKILRIYGAEAERAIIVNTGIELNKYLDTVADVIG